MDLKEIQDRNYLATQNRGLINEGTNPIDFENKLIEEVEEFKTAFLYEKEQLMFVDESEIADIIIVLLNLSKHYNIDIQKALEEKTIYNEKRD